MTREIETSYNNLKKVINCFNYKNITQDLNII